MESIRNILGVSGLCGAAHRVGKQMRMRYETRPEIERVYFARPCAGCATTDPNTLTSGDTAGRRPMKVKESLFMCDHVLHVGTREVSPRRD